MRPCGGTHALVRLWMWNVRSNPLLLVRCYGDTLVGTTWYVTGLLWFSSAGALNGEV